MLMFFLFSYGTAQDYDTVKYKVIFLSARESMWNAGSNFAIPTMNKNYSFSWDESTSIGGMESLIGMDFGARLYGATKGTVGFGFYMTKINGGTIDQVRYPVEVEFMLPKGEDIRAGQTFKIASRAVVNPSDKPSFSTTFPLEGEIGLNLLVDLETDLNFSVCAFDKCLKVDPKKLAGCVDSIMDLKFGPEFLKLSTLDGNPRAVIPDVTNLPCIGGLGFNIPCIGHVGLFSGIDFAYWPTTKTVEFFPIEFGINRTIKSNHPLSYYKKCIQDTLHPGYCAATQTAKLAIKNSKLDNFIEGSFSLPFITDLNTTIQQNNLYATGLDTSLSIRLKPLNLVAGGKFTDGSFEFRIPCTSKDFYVDYMLARPLITFDALLKQDFQLNAQVMVKIELPTKLNYRVVNKAGILVKEGANDVIMYEVGHDLFIDFPCNYEFMDFKPSFSVENKFTNRTYASLNFSGRFQALEMGIGMDEITVTPEFEACVWIPFVGEECVTIPALKFDFDVSVGPLIDANLSQFMSNPNDLNVEIDIFKKSWEIESFNSISLPAFRVSPLRLTTDIPPDTILCYGSATGALEVNISGGTAPFNYKWSNGTSSKIASGLTAGDYYVNVTDANGCQSLNGATVFEFPELIVHTTDTIHPDCYNHNTGTIITETEGGNPPYSYTWSDETTDANLRDAVAGIYSLTVTDLNNCKKILNYTLDHPPQLQSEISNITHVKCNGMKTGKIRLNAAGGVPGYDFQWSSGAISQYVDSLYAGDYYVTIIDRNNCRIIDSATITQPDILTAQINVQKPISCYRGTDGMLFADIKGGVKPYNITWYTPENTVNTQQEVLGGLSKGVYQIEVFDAHGCYRKDSLLLNAPDVPFRSELLEKHLSCKGSDDGEFNLTVSGGTPPYVYTWSDGSAEADRKNMPAAKYKVTITDAMACETYNNMVLLEPPGLGGKFIVKKVSCEGESDGQLEFLATGGTPPYSFYWNSGAEGAIAENLQEGYQYVLVKDAKGCEHEFDYDLPVDGTRCFDIPNAFSPNSDGYNDTWVIKNISTMFPQHKVEIFTQQGNKIYASGNAGYQPWDGKWKGTDMPPGTYYYIIDFGNGEDIIKGTLTIFR